MTRHSFIATIVLLVFSLAMSTAILYAASFSALPPTESVLAIVIVWSVLVLPELGAAFWLILRKDANVTEIPMFEIDEIAEPIEDASTIITDEKELVPEKRVVEPFP